MIIRVFDIFPFIYVRRIIISVRCKLENALFQKEFWLILMNL